MNNNIDKYTAERILDLKETYSKKDINDAYRNQVKKNHPDAGGSAYIMMQINSAKDYLDGFFVGKEEGYTLTCSTSGSQAEPERNATSAATSTESDADSASASSGSTDAGDDPADDFFRYAYEHNGSEKDAPFTNREYTAKAQSEWDDADWDAFKSFQPPKSWRGYEYDVQRANFWHADDAQMADAGNIDVSSWTDRDWYFYWFVNARNPRDDDRVYTRLEATPLYGPYAERARARKQPGYYEKARKFQRPENPDWVDTPYGRVCILEGGPDGYYTLEKSGWTGNVGVPFVYALCEDYDLWLEDNLKAQREALANRRGKHKETPVAATWGWMGWEFDPDSKEGANYAEAKSNPKDPKMKEAPTSSSEQKAADDSWSVKLAKAESAAYRNMGIHKVSDIDEEPWGHAKKYYNRNRIPNAPAWYNALNAVLNRIPWRTLAWIVIAIWLGCVWAGGETTWFGAYLLVGLVIGGVNQTGYFSNMVRGVLRGVLDGALKVWAKATHTDIDWVAARNIQ